MGMTQEELAVKLYTKKVTISAYENDRIDLKCSMAIELANCLGCSVEYLLKGKYNEANSNELVRLYHHIKSDKVREVAIEQLRILTSI